MKITTKQKLLLANYFMMVFALAAIGMMYTYFKYPNIQYKSITQYVPQEITKTVEVHTPDQCSQTDIIDWDSIMYIFNDMNKQRQLNHVPELKMSADLNRLANHKADVYWKELAVDTAQAWKHDIADRPLRNIYFEDCYSLFDPKPVGENLATTIPQVTVERWLASKEHHDVMLDPQYTYVGIYSGWNGTSFYHVATFSN